MCSVLISEREASQIDMVIIALVTADRIVAAAGISTTTIADTLNYLHSVKT